MSYTKEESDIIVVDSFKELDYKQKKLLLAANNQGNADRLKYADALIKICGEGVYNKLSALLEDDAYRQKTIEKLSKSNIVCVTLKSGNFPPLLREIPVPPLALYLRGNTRLLERDMFGVVGSRKTVITVYEQCSALCAELTEHFAVVTGVADGADSAAACGALTKGAAICVLPGGHDASNGASVKLLKRAEKEGLTLSEFPPGIPAKRYTFLLRNRIIAGLCRGVLVVSAAEKSGALNTAGYAVDYGRDVFAFPYNVGVASGKGCNNLLRKGATICENAADVLSFYGLKAKEKSLPELDEDEMLLLKLLKEEGELHAGRISEILKKPLSQVFALCSMLEIKGLALKVGGNKYSAI